MTGHTPGPWIKDGLTVYALMETGRFRNGKPAMTNRFTVNVQPAPAALLEGSMLEAEANARLISAAPDLYALAKQISEPASLANFEATVAEWMVEAKRLVARAEGRS